MYRCRVAVRLQDLRRLMWGASWPLHDIVITNIVWCMPYKGEVEGGGRVCSPIVVQ